MNALSPNRLLDSALDLLVVPGYTSLGPRLRRRGWEALPAGALRDRTMLVTGASSGIGERVCEGLAALGARVHLLARDPERGAAARERIERRLAAGGDPDAARRLELELCDVADLDDVRRFAADFASRTDSLHGLVHNAGVLLAEPARSGGRELTLATHVLGPFLLTNLLLTALRRGAPSRVVFVSSGGMYTARLHSDDLELDREDFDGARFYAHAKRVQVLLAELWAERERSSGVSFFSVHPGWVDTPGVERSLPRFHRALGPLLRDPEQGADTVIWLEAAPGLEAQTGAFFHDRRARPKYRLPRTRESAVERARLWGQLSRLSGWVEPGGEV
jgi:dehydrogenase/reductase SDR family protein 12